MSKASMWRACLDMLKKILYWPWRILKWPSIILVVLIVWDPPEVIISKYDLGWARVEEVDGEYLYSGKISLSAVEVIPKGETVRFIYSSGGTVPGREYLFSHRIIVDGVCVSACAKLFILSDDACYTDRAVFKFHATHEGNPSIPLPEWIYGRSAKLMWRLDDRVVEETREFVQTIREPLRKFLRGLPDTSKVITPPQGLVQSTYPERKC